MRPSFDSDTRIHKRTLARFKPAGRIGYRGAPAADTDALADLMVRLGRFAADHADTVAEIDLNPVIVHAQGAGVSVVDALIVKGGTPRGERVAHLRGPS